jgi:chromosome segregation ATPase
MQHTVCRFRPACDADLDIVAPCRWQREIEELELAVAGPEANPLDLTDDDYQRRELTGSIKAVDHELARIQSQARYLTEKLNHNFQRRTTSDEPVSKLLKVFNAHQQTLEWLKRAGAEVTGEVESLDWKLKTRSGPLPP